MTLTAPEADALARVLRALGGHESQFVLGGGWAHRLMRRHPAARPPAHPPLVTTDRAPTPVAATRRRRRTPAHDLCGETWRIAPVLAAKSGHAR